MLGAMKSHPLQLFVLAVVAVLAGCSKKPGRRAQVVECSAISLDAKGTVQCLVGLYHWSVADAQKAATDRAHERESLKTHQEDSGWALGSVKHRRDLQTCSHADDQLRSCLLVAGGRLWRAKATQGSMWSAELSAHRHELARGGGKGDCN